MMVVSILVKKLFVRFWCDVRLEFMLVKLLLILNRFDRFRLMRKSR